MKVSGIDYNTIWLKDGDETCVQVIDQRFLPFEFVVEDLKTSEEIAVAIKDMHVRGAPLIGVAAAFGVYLAVRESETEAQFEEKINRLRDSRPTAVNLFWAIDRQLELLSSSGDREKRIELSLQGAKKIKQEEIDRCRMIGEHGFPIVESLSKAKGSEPVNILTHCNAGWLACVDYGTATSPIYLAHDAGIPVHVWVDETRPRNQGASLTAWELQQHGVPHTVIADNTGGHLMQAGLVDMVIVGTDRTTRTGDVANKIGTYLKALAAKDNGVPFYVAAPGSSIDWDLEKGSDIPIELRDELEVTCIQGYCDGEIVQVRLTPEGSKAANYAFDVTPARLVTSLITESGVCSADEESIRSLFNKE